jgi:hypothetical protein
MLISTHTNVPPQCDALTKGVLLSDYCYFAGVWHLCGIVESACYLLYTCPVFFFANNACHHREVVHFIVCLKNCMLDVI